MINNDLCVTAVQFDVAWESPQLNFDRIESLLAKSEIHSDLILLPEMFNSGFTLKPQQVASDMDGECVTWMKLLAKEKNAIVAGSIVINYLSGYYNRFIAAYPTGEIEWYDKRHLFRMGGENDSYTPGEKRKIINIKGWRCALFVCYDLRFPVWSRSVNNYDVALYVANWPEARIDAWNTLLRARAIENQCYVIGVNRVGKDGLGVYSGSSMIIDFKGQLLAGPALQKECLIQSKLYMKPLKEYIQNFPAWMDADKFLIE